MPISKPIIAAGPTVKRGKAKGTKLLISSALPGTQRRYIDENGQLTLDDQLPQREGQLFAYRNGSDPGASLYVAVDMNGTLEWKRVVPGLNMINSSTGNAWDPLAGFYDPLAS
jgi:hypothetical protein